jgi:hypothetical protein
MIYRPESSSGSSEMTSIPSRHQPAVSDMELQHSRGVILRGLVFGVVVAFFWGDTERLRERERLRPFAGDLRWVA